jgi:hypothetical protein
MKTTDGRSECIIYDACRLGPFIWASDSKFNFKKLPPYRFQFIQFQIFILNFLFKVKAIRKKMVEIINKEINGSDLKQVVSKL